nr:unnamed protein product [Callosobruchus analis]
MCIKFCGAFELALRPHNETSTSHNPGIYVGLVNFTAEIDALLAIHMKGSQVFKGISKTIQNELFIRSSSSPSQILTAKLFTFFPPREQGERILCTKSRGKFFSCPPSLKAHEPPRYIVISILNGGRAGKLGLRRANTLKIAVVKEAYLIIYILYPVIMHIV